MLQFLCQTPKSTFELLVPTNNFDDFLQLALRLEGQAVTSNGVAVS